MVVDLNFMQQTIRALTHSWEDFWQIDPMDGLTQNTSLYVFAGNNPIFLLILLGFGKDSTKTSKGEMAYANQPWNEAIVITTKPKLKWFFWPNDINQKNIKIWDHDKNLAIRRQENGEPLVQGGESDNYLSKLNWYKQLYKSDQDYRIMSMVAVSILMSPILIEELSAGLTSEEFAQLINTSAKLMEKAKGLTELSTVQGTIAANQLRAKAAELIVRFLSGNKKKHIKSRVPTLLPL